MYISRSNSREQRSPYSPQHQAKHSKDDHGQEKPQERPLAEDTIDISIELLSVATPSDSPLKSAAEGAEIPGAPRIDIKA